MEVTQSLTADDGSPAVTAATAAASISCAWLNCTSEVQNCTTAGVGSSGGCFSVVDGRDRDILDTAADAVTRAPANDLTYRVTVAILLSVIIICTIVGNVFVVMAVVREKVLHKTLSNRLIGSLAVTDLLVAVLVMPLTAVKLIAVVWPFGRAMCDFFVFIDVLFCTSSILHLVAIAVDRYWTVTDVEYAQKIGKRQAAVFYTMVALAWGVAACVCIPPLFEWREEYEEGVCRISQDINYTIYSTLLAFYVPLLVIIAIYGKIFFIVRQRVRQRLLSHRTQITELSVAPPAAAAAAAGKEESVAYDDEKTIAVAGFVAATGDQANGADGCGDVGPTTRLLQPPSTEPLLRSTPPRTTTTATLNGDAAVQPYVNGTLAANGPLATQQVYASSSSSSAASTAKNKKKKIPCGGGGGYDSSTRKLVASPRHGRTPYNGGGSKASAGGGSATLPDDAARRWEKVAVKRERRALRTLLIITGIFVLCWLPFFVFAALMPFCRGCQVPKTVLDLVNWLGYCNSALNPIIYTIFSPDFRKAFRKILLGQYRCLS